MAVVSSRSVLFLFTTFALSLIACSEGDPLPTDDAAVANDASEQDAFDPYATPEVCSSGTTWTHGDIGSQYMHPGRPCVSCHASHRGPFLTLAGTIYPTAHEPDECNGVNGFDNDVHVVVTDANGVVVDLQINDVGNFFSQDAVTLPITAELRYQGRTRTMTTPAPSGDCNSCHTDTGTSAAPGRLMAP